MAVYKDFSEVEDDIRENTPPIIYKYRQWDDKYHKKIITHRELFLAHPHDLNDKTEFRKPYHFNTSLVTSENVRNKLEEGVGSVYPTWTKERRAREIEIVHDAIMKNPKEYFKKNLKDYHNNRSNYDRVGILSLCSSYDNNHVWNVYGKNHEGFAVGYNTVELARHLNCTLSFVNYTDEEMEYICLGDNLELMDREARTKSKIWEPEQELRFVTLGIGVNRENVSQFPAESVKEIVLGMNAIQVTQDEIMEAAKATMADVPIYKLKLKEDGSGVDKVLISK